MLASFRVARPATTILFRGKVSLGRNKTVASLCGTSYRQCATNSNAEKKESPVLSETEQKLTIEVEKLTSAVTELTDKTKQLDDKYKRALADGENLRTRLTKQIEDAKLFGIQNFCKDLLVVADTLAIATESVPKDEVSEKNPHLKNLYEGLTMTKASLDQVFKRNGLATINPLNEKFDPNLHEALFQQPVENVEPNTVVVVSKIGYKLHERCIRPALVGVSVAKQ